MKTLRKQEGVLLIDHRNSPGITPEFMRQHNLPGPVVGAGQKYESALYNCKHCSADVIINPKRNRSREYCRRCDGYICDNCGLMRKCGAPHRPLWQVLEHLFNRYVRLAS